MKHTTNDEQRLPSTAPTGQPPASTNNTIKPDDIVTTLRGRFAGSKIAGGISPAVTATPEDLAKKIQANIDQLRANLEREDDIVSSFVRYRWGIPAGITKPITRLFSRILGAPK